VSSPLYFNDLHVGMEWTSAGRTVTEADIVAFAGVSGDFNPLHTDSVFAARTACGERIAHGALVLSIATRLRQQMGLLTGTLSGLLGDPVMALPRPSTKGEQGVVVQRVNVVNQLESNELVTLLQARQAVSA
jgi:hypothetical protein